MHHGAFKIAVMIGTARGNQSDIPARAASATCNNSCSSPLGFSMPAVRPACRNRRRIRAKQIPAPHQNRHPKKSRRAATQTRPPMPTGVRVRRWFPRPAQNQMRAEVQSAGVFGQRVAVDEFRARLRQRALIECGKLSVELLREDELQNRVTEKFQPLIVRSRPFRFHGRRMDA